MHDAWHSSRKRQRGAVTFRKSRCLNPPGHRIMAPCPGGSRNGATITSAASTLPRVLAGDVGAGPGARAQGGNQTEASPGHSQALPHQGDVLKYAREPGFGE